MSKSVSLTRSPCFFEVRGGQGDPQVHQGLLGGAEGEQGGRHLEELRGVREQHRHRGLRVVHRRLAAVPLSTATHASLRLLKAGETVCQKSALKNASAFAIGSSINVLANDKRRNLLSKTYASLTKSARISTKSHRF